MNLCAEGGVDKMKIWHAPSLPAWGWGGGGWGGSQNFQGKFEIA